MGLSIQQAGADRLQIREGGGGIALFGLPFLLAGVCIVGLAVGIVPISNAGDVPFYAWPLLWLMGAAFTAVGGTLVFGRSWVTVDAARRIVSKEWGWIVPMRRAIHPIEDAALVTLEFVEGDSDTADKYPVGLKRRAGDTLPVSSFMRFEDARACATALARHLAIDIEDASTDSAVRVSPDEANLSLRERRRARPFAESTSRPPAARSDVVHHSGSTQILIPKPHVHPVALIVGLAVASIPWVMLSSFLDFFRRTDTPPIVGWVFLAFLIGAFGVLPALVTLGAFLRSRLGRTIVVVSPEGLRIMERGVWRTTTVASHAAAEILDVDCSTRDSMLASARRSAERKAREAYPAEPAAAVGPRLERLLTTLSRFAKSKGVVVKTRQGLTRFGEGLDDDEVRYLQSVTRRALTAATVETRPPR
jgi:hypothetical protein